MTTCRPHNVPLLAAALQFPLGHPIVASVIAETISPAQVAQNLAAFNHPIPADLWAERKHERLMRSDIPSSAYGPSLNGLRDQHYWIC
jgi:D-threo-aldose 1-dehydrogenase